MNLADLKALAMTAHRFRGKGEIPWFMSEEFAENGWALELADYFASLPTERVLAMIACIEAADRMGHGAWSKHPVDKAYYAARAELEALK